MRSNAHYGFLASLRGADLVFFSSAIFVPCRAVLLSMLTDALPGFKSSKIRMNLNLLTEAEAKAVYEEVLSENIEGVQDDEEPGAHPGGDRADLAALRAEDSGY
ncbi:hypothetical protein C8J57DRAFT_1310348, partial [Mycena rebaudengoi]